jgi:hypothetical protein
VSIVKRVILIAACCLWLAAGGIGPVAATTPPPPQAAVDFNHPPREYATRTYQGWTIYIEDELLLNDPALAEKALSRLDEKLDKVLSLIPPTARAGMQKLPIFLLYGTSASHGGRNNGAEYFQRIAPVHFSSLDPRMAGSIVIYSAENFVWLPDIWAIKVLIHEFAHARQLEQWPEEQIEFMKPYQAAMLQGLYRNVREMDGSTIETAYAATNQLEYFAELSCMYFCGCNYYPFNRDQLRQYDPGGYHMVRAMWGDDAPENDNSRINADAK